MNEVTRNDDNAPRPRPMLREHPIIVPANSACSASTALDPYIIAKLTKYPFVTENNRMKMEGKASWLKTTNSVLGCALQKMKIGMKSRRRTEIRGRIHFGQCFLGNWKKPGRDRPK